MLILSFSDYLLQDERLYYCPKQCRFFVCLFIYLFIYFIYFISVIYLFIFAKAHKACLIFGWSAVNSSIGYRRELIGPMSLGKVLEFVQNFANLYKIGFRRQLMQRVKKKKKKKTPRVVRSSTKLCIISGTFFFWECPFVQFWTNGYNNMIQCKWLLQDFCLCNLEVVV